MTARTGGSTTSAAAGGKLQAVRHPDTILNLDLENGATLEIQTAESTASVMVRDKDPA